eukprot:1858667-Amphidinium_carterae.1
MFVNCYNHHSCTITENVRTANVVVILSPLYEHAAMQAASRLASETLWIEGYHQSQDHCTMSKR